LFQVSINRSTFTSIYTLLSTAILSIAVFLGSLPEYENKQQHYAYANTTTENLPGFNFAAAGNWGCNFNTTNTVNNIVDKNPEIALGLGDYEYHEGNADCWFDIIQPIDNIMKIAIGNHELEDSKLPQYMEHFNLTMQYYSFDYQNVHFTVMADYVPYGIGSEQYIFVKDDLAKAAANPNIDWIVVTHHSQMYASTQKFDIPEEKEWNNIYHPLFEQYFVDLILQGHQHNYQRTYPIKYNSDSPMYPIITDKKRDNYTNPEGQIYLTVGTGGVNLHELNRNKAPYIITVQDEAYGFLNIDVTAKFLNIDATAKLGERSTMLVGKFYKNDDSGGGGGGAVTDQFTITKSE
jgi:hypothetical protein